jgi:hypothetical protein
VEGRSPAGRDGGCSAKWLVNSVGAPTPRRASKKVYIEVTEGHGGGNPN